MKEWRENQKNEYRNDYLFDCGELGIAKLYYTYSNVAGGNWVVTWPLVEPCPIKLEEGG